MHAFSGYLVEIWKSKWFVLFAQGLSDTALCLVTLSESAMVKYSLTSMISTWSLLILMHNPATRDLYNCLPFVADGCAGDSHAFYPVSGTVDRTFLRIRIRWCCNSPRGFIQIKEFHSFYMAVCGSGPWMNVRVFCRVCRIHVKLTTYAYEEKGYNFFFTFVFGFEEEMIHSHHLLSYVHCVCWCGHCCFEGADRLCSSPNCLCAECWNSSQADVSIKWEPGTQVFPSVSAHIFMGNSRSKRCVAVFQKTEWKLREWEVLSSWQRDF